MTFILRTIRSLLMLSLSISLLTGISKVMDDYVDFNYLTDFFILIRRFVSIFDFTFDTTTLLTFVGYAFIIQVSYSFVLIFKYIMNFITKK